MDSKVTWNRRVLVVCIVVTMVVATIGGQLTEIGPWYFALKKPWWQPPDWAFGPAWTIIFAVTAVAAHHAWVTATEARERAWVVLLFAANAALNVAWSYIFFTLRRPDWALIEVGFFWVSIVVLIVVIGRRNGRVAALLVPYLAWVSFAAFLNWTVVQLNAPFA